MTAALAREDTRAAGLIPAARQPGTPPAGPRRYDWAAWASAAFIAAANVLAVTGYRVALIGPAIGFWFLVVHPVYLLSTTSVWPGSSANERIGYSLTALLLLLLVGGLGINTVLPLVGVARPLDPVPVVAMGDAITVAAYLLRRRHPAKVAWWPCVQAIGPEGSRLLAGSGLCVALVVLGANRLNNGAGGQVSLVALGGILVLAVFVLRWRHRVSDGVIGATLYLLSLALLLMTSLRGWFVSGHDIQTEYLAFQLTYAHAHWDMASFHNAYNACLSITILPTEFAQILNIDHPYVYKLFFQLIFAACPVLVYAISRRYSPKWAAILAVIYFVAFPTFFTDLPFLNRQELALLFVCVAILAITNTAWSLRWRQIALVVACLGVELSHYSTMYLFLGTLVVAWAARNAKAWLPRRWQWPRRATRPRGSSWGVLARTLSIGSILVVFAVTFAWGDLATGTAGGAVTDVVSALASLAGKSPGVRSSDVSYGLLSGNAPSPQAVLNDYRRETLRARTGAPPSTYLPASLVARYPTPVVPVPSPLPLTAIGSVLTDLGVPVAGLNALIRQAAAKGEQLFVAIGLVALFWSRKRRRQVSYEYFCLCFGSISVVAIITVLPNLSADYAVLRAFQEALIVIAPVLVAGSATAFRPLGRLWSRRGATAVCLILCASTTGFLPQLLGGYPPQLGLNNSGQYYEIYYTHPQEVAAVDWLADKPDVLPDGVQAEDFTDRFAFTSPSRVSGQQFITDIYPTLIRRSSWVILGSSNVHSGRASLFYDGDLITYVYPIGFLRVSKNLVYNDGGAEIYR